MKLDIKRLDEILTKKAKEIGIDIEEAEEEYGELEMFGKSYLVIERKVIENMQRCYLESIREYIEQSAEEHKVAGGKDE